MKNPKSLTYTYTKPVSKTPKVIVCKASPCLSEMLWCLHWPVHTFLSPLNYFWLIQCKQLLSCVKNDKDKHLFVFSSSIAPLPPIIFGPLLVKSLDGETTQHVLAFVVWLLPLPSPFPERCSYRYTSPRLVWDQAQDLGMLSKHSVLSCTPAQKPRTWGPAAFSPSPKWREKQVDDVLLWETSTCWSPCEQRWEQERINGAEERRHYGACIFTDRRLYSSMTGWEKRRLETEYCNTANPTIL